MRKGDRVAGVMTNSQEALVCMLGVTAVGAIWRCAKGDDQATIRSRFFYPFVELFREFLLFVDFWLSRPGVEHTTKKIVTFLKQVLSRLTALECCK